MGVGVQPEAGCPHVTAYPRQRPVTVELVIIIVLAVAAMMIWYVGQPIVVTIIDEGKSITVLNNWDTTGSNNTYDMLKFFVNISGAVAVIILLVFAVALAQRRDWRGYDY